MKDKLITISGTIVFAVILAGIFYISFFTEETKKEVFNNIILNGNKLQSIDGYLMSSDLNKSVTLPVCSNLCLALSNLFNPVLGL